jgi:hypothetical protein
MPGRFFSLAFLLVATRSLRVLSAKHHEREHSPPPFPGVIYSRQLRQPKISGSQWGGGHCQVQEEQHDGAQQQQEHRPSHACSSY